ncbi:MAG TPA: tRNA (guanosine(37)-N1)-methyltransferase TrmD [Arenibaculum sp.]|nr:tRNA (guanosine(37)-N1)-methyltransferase TrmD [Arenibaculum sp.]
MPVHASSGAPWTVRVLTLFPEMFPGPLGFSLAGKALENRLWLLETVDIRSFARDKHRSVDDAPFGGGPGMVMRPDVLDAALTAATGGPEAPGRGRVIYPSPRGRLLNQELVRDLVAEPLVTVLCGRYEGVDERVLEKHAAEEVSVGDYVLSGGEPAALVMIDAAVRLLPGVMGNVETAGEESFEGGLLEYPHYTRPALWEGRAVPEVLISGHHEKVGAWRLAEAERITRERRPDLWAAYAGRRGAGESSKPRRRRRNAENAVRRDGAPSE